jgi:RNA polymerase sigma factor (TIGR02999 family)
MQGELTDLLGRMRDGDEAATAALFDRLYPELREIAGRVFRSQRRDHTLQPTALVNEAWLKMARPAGGAPDFADRAHFLAVAATAMRQILVNHARDRSAQKRGGGVDRRRLTLAGVVLPDRDPAEVLTVDEVLTELRSLNERQAKIAEMRFFGGLTNPEIAAALGVSLRTVELDWKMAKGWLAGKLEPGAET